MLASAATWSNLNSTATNPSNSFSAGTVQIGSNSGSSAVLSLINAKPGAVSTGCIKVTYTGTLPVHGEALRKQRRHRPEPVSEAGCHPRHLQRHSHRRLVHRLHRRLHELHRPGRRRHLQRHAGQLAHHRGAALVDPTAASPAMWSTGTAHGYQLQVTLLSNAAGQGLTGTETFTFEADNN